jgi:3-phosphoshikimate 1-carboxyvinyltransferase
VKLQTQGPAAPLRGELLVPGDKSISHRAVILASLASGQSSIAGLLEGEDVRATIRACRQLGMDCRREDGLLLVRGVGKEGLACPDATLDMGNSGTAMRLLTGVLAGQPFDSVLTGDRSLSSRPMQRIVKPLGMMGAHIETSDSGTAPLHIRGNPRLRGIDYAMPVASAQVKSCLLLAGLNASGRTRITEPQPSRDHTEKMLPSFGVELSGPCAVRGGGNLTGADIRVPGDISSAAFFMVGAAMVPGSELMLQNVGINPTRDGVLRVLKAMGAHIELHSERFYGEEKVADILLRHAPGLRGIDVPESWVPSLIDELPAVMVLAACAEGRTRIRGAAELRVKESDRIAVMAAGLAALGVRLQEYEDGIDIAGGPIRGGAVDGAGDHRCAMSFCMLGQAAPARVTVAGCSHIDTSFPTFAQDLLQVGGKIETLNEEAEA